jgi:hypothetical protein
MSAEYDDFQRNPLVIIDLTDGVLIKSWPFLDKEFLEFDLDLSNVSAVDFYEMIEQFIIDKISVSIRLILNKLSPESFSLLYRAISIKSASEQKHCNFGYVIFDINIE